MRVAVISEAKPAFHLPGEPTLPFPSLSLSSPPCFLHQRESHCPLQFDSRGEGDRDETAVDETDRERHPRTGEMALIQFRAAANRRDSIVLRPAESAVLRGGQLG